MSDPSFRIIRADWQRDRAALRRVRETVFVAEQKVPPDLEWDGLDAACEHVLALDTDGRAIGTARLTPEHAIGRMAVLSTWRGRGIGAAMLHALIARAQAQHWQHVSLHAQVAAIGFYQRFGFHCHGEEFIEAGIRHRHMTRALPAGK
jgi:predicted GNAT family N-acyltransferase